MPLVAEARPKVAATYTVSRSREDYSVIPRYRQNFFAATATSFSKAFPSHPLETSTQLPSIPYLPPSPNPHLDISTQAPTIIHHNSPLKIPYYYSITTNFKTLSMFPEKNIEKTVQPSPSTQPQSNTSYSTSSRTQQRILFPPPTHSMQDFSSVHSSKTQQADTSSFADQTRLTLPDKLHNRLRPLSSRTMTQCALLLGLCCAIVRFSRMAVENMLFVL